MAARTVALSVAWSAGLMVASMVKSKVDRTARYWVATTAEKMPVPRAVLMVDSLARTVALSVA